MANTSMEVDMQGQSQQPPFQQPPQPPPPPQPHRFPPPQPPQPSKRSQSRRPTYSPITPSPGPQPPQTPSFNVQRIDPEYPDSDPDTDGDPYADLDADDDPDREVTAIHSAGQAYFPGVPERWITTVARHVTGYEKKPQRVKYLNRYGPRKYAWYVWEESTNLSNEEAKNLLDLADNADRVLDHKIDKSADDPEKLLRVRSSEIAGVKNMVWDYGNKASHPLEAAELLNPKTVKLTEKFPDKQARIANRKELSKFPITYLEIQFKRPVKTWMHESKKKTILGERQTNWELSSKYRMLCKDQFAVEDLLYRTAKEYARAFMSWYETVNTPILPTIENRSLSRSVAGRDLRLATPSGRSDRGVTSTPTNRTFVKPEPNEQGRPLNSIPEQEEEEEGDEDDNALKASGFLSAWTETHGTPKNKKEMKEFKFYCEAKGFEIRLPDIEKLCITK